MHVSSVENEGYFRRIGRVGVIVKPQPGAGLQPASRGQVRCALSGWGWRGGQLEESEWDPGGRALVCKGLRVLYSFIFVF